MEKNPERQKKEPRNLERVWASRKEGNREHEKDTPLPSLPRGKMKKRYNKTEKTENTHT